VLCAIAIAIARQHDATVTSIASDKQYPVIFEPAGQMAMTNAYLHVLINLNISYILNNMSMLESKLHSFVRTTIQNNQARFGNDCPITNRNSELFRNSSLVSTVIGRFSKQLNFFCHSINTLPRSNGVTVTIKDFQFNPAIKFGTN